MQIKITGDKAEWIEQKEINAGAIDYYKINCEFSEEWEGLTKYAVFVQDCKAVSIAVIDNVLTVPKLEYVNSTKFGFVGYQIENEEKTKQISTNMLTKYILDGAGDYEAEGHDMPTPSEWEIYLQTIQELISQVHSIPAGGTTGQVLKKASNTDYDVFWSTGGGGEGGDATYIHRQDVSSSEWNINHNLEKYPSVSIVDSSGNSIFGDILYIDINNVKINFSGAFTGKAYLN